MEHAHRIMLFQMLLSLSLAFGHGLMLNIGGKHPEKCLFHMDARSGPSEGKTLLRLCTFATLDTVTMLECLRQDRLSKEEQRIFAERLEIVVTGSCIPDRGWNILALHTDKSVSKFQMNLIPIQDAKCDLTETCYPQTNAMHLVHIEIAWTVHSENDNHFVTFEEANVARKNPFYHSEPEADNFIIFPDTGLDTRDLDWSPFDAQPTSFGSEHICLLDLLGSPHLQLISSGPRMVVFESTENRPPAPRWRLKSGLYHEEYEETRSRFYVDRYLPGAYYLNALKYKDDPIFYGFVLV